MILETFHTSYEVSSYDFFMIFYDLFMTRFCNL
jgi:hypothetical protein